LTGDFLSVVKHYMGKVEGECLVVGQRWDFDNEAGEWSFDDHWEARYLEGIRKTIHAPAGSDWFLFRKGQYPDGRLPPLVIGRPGWDLCMLYHARRERMPVVDVSTRYLVFHQNHDYRHKKATYDSIYDDPEAMFNLTELPEDGKFLFTLLACNREVSRSGVLEPCCARGDGEKFLAIERVLGTSVLHRWTQLVKYRLRQWSRKTWSRRARRSRVGLAGFIRRFHDRGDVRFDIGAGTLCVDSVWIKSDLTMLDITKEDQWQAVLGDVRMSKVVAEHVWEHLSQEDAHRATRNVFRFLKPGGHFRVAVPDGYFPDPAYLRHVRPGGAGPGADDHKVLYNVASLSAVLHQVGFDVRPLEYWDERGEFHFCDWSVDDGMVTRSRRYDERNKTGRMTYTSLIIDAVKP